MEIQGKVIIVTGASQGIGEAISKLLAKHGAKLVLAARSKDKLENLAKELPDSLVVPTDMRKSEDIKNLIDKTLQKYSRVDILINDAGQGIYGAMETVNLEEFKQTMELNVYAVLRAMQLVIPIMRKAGGGIILNVSSRVSKNYFPYLGAYAATKYALNAISLTARAELEKDNIIVSVFHPKMTATKFGEHAMGSRPAWNDTRATGRPAPDVDTPEQVAEQILELIKSEAPEGSM